VTPHRNDDAADAETFWAVFVWVPAVFVVAMACFAFTLFAVWKLGSGHNDFAIDGAGIASALIGAWLMKRIRSRFSK
jgi:di/tricarboxylate transporter